MRVEALDEVGADARDQRLEARVPAVLVGVEAAVALDDPADVAGLRRPQQPGRGAARPLAEERFDRRGGLDEAPLLAVGQGGEQRRGVGLALRGRAARTRAGRRR